MKEEVRNGAISWKFMLPLVLGTMMNPLNSTMLATALLTVCNSFHVSMGQGAILISCLYITATIAQPLMGRLADIYSARKINTLGFILVLAAAAIGAFAPYFSWLILSRIILGLGTSAAYPSAIALINRKYSAAGIPVPGQVLGVVAVSSQVSMVIGPVLGGLLTQWLGWQGIFLINIPWVFIALFLSRSLPDFPRQMAGPVAGDTKSGLQTTDSTGKTNITSMKKGGGSGTESGIFKKLDIPGILFFSGLLLTFLLVLTGSTFHWELVIPPVIFLGLLVFWELRQSSPFIDVRLFYHKPALALVYLRTMVTSAILYQMLYAMPPWIEAIKHLSPASTGMLVLPESAMAILAGLLVAKSTRLFRQNLLGVFIVVIACSCWYLLKASSGILFILLVAIIMGIADGLNLIANQALLNKETPLEQKGVSFGLYRTFGYIGAIISSTQLKTLFREGVTDENFHKTGLYVLYSSGILVLLLIPLWLRKRADDRKAGAAPGELITAAG